eukprot:Plantae.Rhodophyta-Purpureofilum_apyrenoidigerum.ctg24218.p1 GENE.Plantae.Rhodophyta-Purpureofilum_apyrenoidigerum.ctg24218~~Plantae.Rhodophyta-Purpureofilum_apyrenoidigerum.ctg24218.p1  ORF type:complete len:839 (+),score=125.75 Plantae.Rhodophyta-Purpureofilum_apyrenoidigerum.ctg24218:281-2797(+)
MVKLVAALVLATLTSVTVAQQLFKPAPCNSDLVSADVSQIKYRSWTSLYGSAGDSDVITIPCGTAVLFDGSGKVQLGALRVEGLLYFPPEVGQVEVVVSYVLVTGKISVGSSSGLNRNSRVVFKLQNGSELEVDIERLTKDEGSGRVISSFSDRAFVVLGGIVDMRGNSEKCSRKTWATLSTGVLAGSTTIFLNQQMDDCWDVGDKIAIASTGYGPEGDDSATITRINGYRIDIDKPLNNSHLGADAQVSRGERILYMAAEVVLLSRRIQIVGSTGGHFMIAHSGQAQHIQGVEFRKLGMQGTLGRYPCHVHMCGNGARNVTIQGNSIHESSQRGIVVHGSHGVTVEYNTLYDIKGHGILAGEDGVEHDLVVRNNVGTKFRKVEILLPDATDNMPAGLWISNPRSTFQNNRFSGSERLCVWFEMHQAVKGLSREIPGGDEVPRNMDLLEFRDQVCHSNGEHALRLYPGRWTPESGRNVINGLIAWRNMEYAVFTHDSMSVTIQNSFLADNLYGAVDFDRQSDSELVDSIVVGKSEHGAECPRNGAIQFHANRYFIDRPAPRVINTAFSGFDSCKSAVFMLDDNDRTQPLLGFPSATTLRNVQVESWDGAFDMEGLALGNMGWRDNVAISLVNCTGISQGTFVSDTTFMKPPNKKMPCKSMNSGALCTGTCYRTVRIDMIRNGGSAYALAVRRTSDGATQLLDQPLKRAYGRISFFFTALVDEEYSIDLAPGDALIPNSIAVALDDNSYSCDEGNVILTFELDSMQLNRFSRGTRTTIVPYSDTCSSEPYIFDRCVGGGLRRTLVLPNKNYDFYDANVDFQASVSAGPPSCKSRGNACL